MASYHTLPTFSQGLTRLVVETPNRTIRVDGWQSADDALKAIKKGQAAFKRKHRARK